MTRTAAVAPSESLVAAPQGYFRQATLPLPSLVFLLPLILIYEVGTLYFTTAAQQGRIQQIIAFGKMQEFFRMCGATGRHMPAMAVVGILLAWHIARKDIWRVDPRVVFGMILESVVLGLPLLALAYFVNRYFPLIGLQANESTISGSLTDRLVMDVGAGVYEEFIFRFVLFTLFTLLLKDLMKLKDQLAWLLMVVLSAVLFSIYHYWSPNEHFVSRIFAFRTIAGIYFGLIFMWRGFGVTAGSHCAYDIIITLT